MTLAKRLVMTLATELESFSNEELLELKAQCHNLENYDWPEYIFRDAFWEMADREQKFRKQEGKEVHDES